MDIFLVKRKDKAYWDEYVEFVVVAKNADEAKDTHPDGSRIDWANVKGDSWVSERINLEVTRIGKADKSFTGIKVICTDYKS